VWRAVTAPVAVVLYGTTFVFESLARAMRERWRYYGGLAATWLVLAAMNLAHEKHGVLFRVFRSFVSFVFFVAARVTAIVV